jgi:hypothetical protein
LAQAFTFRAFGAGEREFKRIVIPVSTNQKLALVCFSVYTLANLS